MAQMEEIYMKELDILRTNMDIIQDRYALQSGHAASKITQLETTIEHMRAKTKMSEKWIQTWLDTRKENVIQMIANRLQ